MTAYKKTPRQLSDRALEHLLKDILEGAQLSRGGCRRELQERCSLPFCTSLRLEDLLGTGAEPKLNS